VGSNEKGQMNSPPTQIEGILEQISPKKGSPSPLDKFKNLSIKIDEKEKLRVVKEESKES
jgi:hypothetical protein